ncbi:MAG: DNA repair protein RecO [Candidatus Bipolaricaulota bacterium]
MAIKRVEAFVIKKVNFKDSDYIVTFFGGDSGKFAGLAKGARKFESKFGGVFDLLNYVEVVYYEGSGLDFLKEGELIRNWEGLRTAPDAINAGLRCARTIDRILEEGGLDKGSFELFWSTLSALDESQGKPKMLELSFHLKLFQLLGYRPVLNRCIECGKSLEGESSVRFRPKEGGAICRDCGTGEGIRISGGLRRGLIKLLALPQDRVRRLKLSEDHMKSGFLLLSRFGRYHFDRSLLPEGLVEDTYI